MRMEREIEIGYATTTLWVVALDVMLTDSRYLVAGLWVMGFDTTAPER